MSAPRMDTREADRILRNAAKRGVAVINRIAEDVLEEATRRVPIATGALLLSGAVDPATPNHPTATVSYGNDDVEYAGYQEFGTSKMKAQPYFQPAIEAVSQKYADGRAFEEIVK